MSRIPSNSNVKGWNRLSVRVVVIVILCSSLLTLLTTAFQLYFDYQKDVKSIHTNILFIEKSYLPAIIFSVYTLDMEQVKTLLDGTLNIIDIEYIEINDTSNNIIKSAGNPTASRDVIRAFPLDYTTTSGKKISLGTLKVSASFEGIYKRLVKEAYLSLLSNMIRMFVAALIFLAIINSIIIRHLRKVSNFTQDLNLDELDKELTLDRETSKFSKYDELDQLVSSLNDMQSRIRDDILMQKKAEDALQEKEQRLLEAQKIALLGRWDLNLINNHLQWSDSVFELFEINSDKFEASYDAFLEAIHPDDRGKVNLAYTESLKDKSPYEISHRLLMTDGRIKWVLEKCRTEYDMQGNALRSIGIIQDITEHKLAEQELTKHREHLEDLVKERTAELEEKNQKLEEFNDLFVNREFRIKELKDKVKELEKNIG